LVAELKAILKLNEGEKKTGVLRTGGNKTLESMRKGGRYSPATGSGVSESQRKKGEINDEGGVFYKGERNREKGGLHIKQMNQKG